MKFNQEIHTFRVWGVPAEIRKFVYSHVMELRELLHQDPSRSKATLSQHIGQLVLTPTETPSGPVYEVSDGGMNLLPGKDVMPLVARDGIEPPTPAFSGLYSSVSKSLIPRNMTMLSRLQTIELLEPIGTSISSLPLKAPSGYRPLCVGTQARTADRYPRSCWPWNASSTPEHPLYLRPPSSARWRTIASAPAS